MFNSPFLDTPFNGNGNLIMSWDKTYHHGNICRINIKTLEAYMNEVRRESLARRSQNMVRFITVTECFKLAQ